MNKEDDFMKFYMLLLAYIRSHPDIDVELNREFEKSLRMFGGMFFEAGWRAGKKEPVQFSDFDKWVN